MQDNNTSPVVKLEYSISNDEENIAFKVFQKKFVLKNNIIKTIIFAVLIGFFIQQVVIKPDYTMAWALIGICFAVTFFVWYNPVKIRKSLLKALKEIENDIYEFDLYPEYFSVKTIYCAENDEVTSLSEMEEEEELKEEPKEIAPRVVYFDKESIQVVEVPEMFVIIIKKETIFVLPKRVISNSQNDEIRKIFKEKVGEDFVIKNC